VRATTFVLITNHSSSFPSSILHFPLIAPT
jgi:hypothetical protein